ncbi:tyrosine-type recombinase/integrase [Nocardioides sp. R-C-SC26]|uniref:tyrosine-type recombinase/integrase n=1 Tax=Nocardioides sp. R-C-SC26 TaxID=2870414 RepID=UPI001E50BB0B|nr:tyrosine-type recombinase/integrase [Nocardioides sp. R-C-SC26]
MASIRERTYASGEKSFAVLYRHGTKQTSKSFGTRKDAEAFATLVDLLGPDRAIKAAAGDARPASPTVAEIASRFFDWKARDVTERTMAEYRRDYRNYIEPWFGHREAETIDEADVQRWVDHMASPRGSDLAPKSVADRHMLLHSIFKFGKARSRGFVSHNPCRETELPRRTRKRVKGTTTAEWRRLISTAENEKANPDLADLVLFLGSLGWRFSEATALPPEAVEDDGKHVWVDVTQVFRLVENKQVLVRDAAKSWAAFRRTRVPTETAEMLRRRLAALGPADRFVFTNKLGNHWNQNTFLRSTWPGLIKAAGLDVDPDRRPTPHWLRHMAVANMTDAGIPMHEVQRIIGHESLETTNNTYGGMVATLSPAGVKALDKVIARKR